jgi:hypothetical protein
MGTSSRALVRAHRGRDTKNVPVKNGRVNGSRKVALHVAARRSMLREVVHPQGVRRPPEAPRMLTSLDQNLLEAVLDSWDRNNQMMVNLLRELPPGALADRATAQSPTIAEMYAHIHYVRLVFTSEDELAGPVTWALLTRKSKAKS